MVLMYLLTELQQQYWRRLCVCPMSKSRFLCFNRASLRLYQFLWRDRQPELFALFFFSVWNEMPWRNKQIIMLPGNFLLKLFWCFDGLLESVMLWIVSSENRSDFPKNFLNFRFDTIEKESIINLSFYRSKSYAFVVLCDSELSLLREENDAAFCPFLYCILIIYSIANSKK